MTTQPHACDAQDCARCIDRDYPVELYLTDRPDLLIKVRAGERMGRFPVRYAFGGWEVQAARAHEAGWRERWHSSEGKWMPLAPFAPPHYVCWESGPNGEDPVRLSFSIRVF